MNYEGGACGTTMEPYSTEPVTLIEEVFPQDTNAYNTLFGGRLLSLMDKAGGIACAKFAHREFVETISIDTLTFIAPHGKATCSKSPAKSSTPAAVQRAPKSLPTP